MAQVGVYTDSWGDIGGGSRFVAVLAEALAQHFNVEMVHHCESFEPDLFAEALEVSFSRIRFRYVSRLCRSVLQPRNPLRRLYAERQLGAEISSRYEFFLASGDIPPLFSHATRSAMLVHFPILGRQQLHSAEPPAWWRPNGLARHAYRWIEWQQRLSTYDQFLCNSFFTRAWLRKRWGVDANIVYPPLRESLRPGPKENLLVSIGRFIPSGSKGQAELIDAFKAMCDGGVSSWKYVLVGATKDARGKAYLTSLRELARGYPIVFRENVSGLELSELLSRAAILWHARGLGVDADKHPEALEHFGMITTEAMASGCIPLVYAAGGLLEIVEDHKNGRLWRSIDELVHITRQLIDHSRARARMGEAAVERAQRFSKQACIESFFGCVSPGLPSSSGSRDAFRGILDPNRGAP